jgi:drug/metabolite transporter (DMT)-like permease
MQIQMKILSRTLSPFFILFIRGLILLGISCIIVRINNLKVHYTDKLVFSMLFKRSILSSVALTCFIGSIPYLPIGIVNSLFNTGPIIIHFLEAVYYKKHLNAIHFILTIVCFVGVLLIVKPGFLFGDKNSFPLLLMCFPLFGALCNSMSMLYLH